VANSYYNQADKVVYDGNLAKAADLNTVNLDVETAFDLVEADITALDGLSEYWAGISEDWATTAEDVEVETGKYSSLHHAAKASASASAASTSASNASTSEGNASDSEAAAALSESNAATSASNASDSASAASTSEGNASTSASNAADSAAAALVSEGNASDSEAAAALSESNAAASETAAGLSEAAAALSESNAATSESNASDSETAAALSESNASDSETAAALSETNAGTSETNAAASEALAEKWAEEVEDTEVETGKYSALHWAAKAEDFASSINPALLVSQTGSTGAAEMPTGTTAQRPTAATGQLRYNTTEESFEGYNGTEWGSIGGGSIAWEDAPTTAPAVITNNSFAGGTGTTPPTDWTKAGGDGSETFTYDGSSDLNVYVATTAVTISQSFTSVIGGIYQLVLPAGITGSSDILVYVDDVLIGTITAVSPAFLHPFQATSTTTTVKFAFNTTTSTHILNSMASYSYTWDIDSGVGYVVQPDFYSNDMAFSLPSAPSDFDEVALLDRNAEASTYNIHVCGNGKKIMGVTDDTFTIDLDRAVVKFIYTGTSQGWVLSESMSVAV